VSDFIHLKLELKVLNKIISGEFFYNLEMGIIIAIGFLCVF